MFYGATDALLDAGQAAQCYTNLISSDTGANLLACYGFLQSLYVQQDAVLVLSRALNISWHPNNDDRLKEIRDIRNRLTGHPALGGEHDRPRRLSSAIIPNDGISSHSFRGHIYYEDGSKNVIVDVEAFRKDNEDRLARQMRAVEATMDNLENEFRAEQAAHPLSSVFGNGFNYLVQRLHCDLSDENRAIQAETHARMILERMDTLRHEFLTRGFKPEADSMRNVFTGLDILVGILTSHTSSGPSQDHFDLVYDGLSKRISSLRNVAEELDSQFRTPVS